MWESLGKLIVAKGFKKQPKGQKITQSGSTGIEARKNITTFNFSSFAWTHS